MSFKIALAEMKRGKMVRRADLPNTAYTVKDGQITVWKFLIGCGWRQWEFLDMDGFVSAVNVLKEDWEVVG